MVDRINVQIKPTIELNTELCLRLKQKTQIDTQYHMYTQYCTYIKWPNNRLYFTYHVLI